MMRDFTLIRYEELLKAFKAGGYSFITYKESLAYNTGKFVILRHDIDKKPANALKTASIEQMLGIKGSYYFRAGRKEEEVPYINKISNLGHEIGYHYEDFSSAGGNYEEAFSSFSVNLFFFRQYYPVTTICMHGNPLSKYDNRLLWSRYDYRLLGIEGEPYFDMDVTSMLYLSDTGRRWDNKASLRDKAGLRSGSNPVPEWGEWVSKPLEKSLIRIGKGEGALHESNIFRTTADIIHTLSSRQMPDRIMINIHPQRWEYKYLPWAKEAVIQNIKNIIKKMLNY
jgi:hypothetical protein